MSNGTAADVCRRGGVIGPNEANLTYQSRIPAAAKLTRDISTWRRRSEWRRERERVAAAAMWEVQEEKRRGEDIKGRERCVASNEG